MYLLQNLCKCRSVEEMVKYVTKVKWFFYGMSCRAVWWKIKIVCRRLLSESLRKKVILYPENGSTIFHRNIGSTYCSQILA